MSLYVFSWNGNLFNGGFFIKLYVCMLFNIMYRTTVVVVMVINKKIILVVYIIKAIQIVKPKFPIMVINSNIRPILRILL